MSSNQIGRAHLPTPLDTLAQNGTTFSTNGKRKNLIVVNGNGTDIRNVNGLKRWAKRKLITQKMMLALIDVVKQKNEPDRIRSFWNTYHCLNRAYSSDGRLYGKYCKNRFCTVCLCIRKAEILNKYLPILQKWEEPFFVTLTIRSVSHERLGLVMNKMIQGFQRIKDKFKKRSQRNRGQKLIGIKSLECNFNPIKKSYNPHFHLIVPNSGTAEILVEEWCKIWTSKWAKRCAQNFRRVKNLERDLIECVKYGTKIFTESDINKKRKQKGTAHIYVCALDNILESMRGHRLFERFGFNIPNYRVKVAKCTPLLYYDEWAFDAGGFDWINLHTERPLSGYQQSNELIRLLQNNIDIELQ